MTQQRTITNRAPDLKAGMTLRDLAKFVQGPMSADADQDATVKVILTWRGSIKEISLVTETEG